MSREFVVRNPDMINENKQNAALLDKLARLVNDDFMQNIDRFNIYAARILGLLYKHFPIPRSLDYKTLTAEQLGTSVEQWWRDVNEDFCDPRPPQVDKTIVTRRSRLLEWEEHSEVAWCTIQWLHDCDYIRTNETIDHINKGPCKYVLSPKGLEVLSIIPESLKPHKTYGEILSDAAGQAGNEARRKAVSEIVGTVIGAAWRATGLGGG